METPADLRIRELFVAHGPALLLYARQWLDGPAAQDVVQDVFVRLIGRRANAGRTAHLAVPLRAQRGH